MLHCISLIFQFLSGVKLAGLEELAVVLHIFVGVTVKITLRAV